MGAGRALVISGAVGVGIYLGLGFPGWLAGAVGVLGFLGLGGWPITRVAYNTLPRDLGWVSPLDKVFLPANAVKLMCKSVKVKPIVAFTGSFGPGVAVYCEYCFFFLNNCCCCYEVSVYNIDNSRNGNVCKMLIIVVGVYL